MRRSPGCTLSVLALVALLAGSTLAAEPTTVHGIEDDSCCDLSPEILRLLDLIEHRARLMPDVARFKWHAQRPITDPDRETAVLAAGTATASAAGLESRGARSFVAAQMRISRDIQRHAFAGYELAPPPPDGPDLASELRPAISATTTATLEVLPRVLPLLPAAAPQILRQLQDRLGPLGGEREAIAALAAALVALIPADRELAQDRITRILSSGLLRVGTTGDYLPFSGIAADGRRQGIDIDLARDLAGHMGVAVEFVATSWPTLMADLEAGRFDIAMSGISRTPQRALSADFSSAYHVGGKTPVTRCDQRQAFAAMADIDQPGVRVIVNPGGTNERFARTHLTQADLRIFDDNTRVFDEIAEGRADIMFTDAIEVARATSLDARLCAAMPGVTLTYQEKGLLLPRDQHDAWRRFVDLWLAQVQGSGRLAAIFAAHGAGAVVP